MFESAELGNSVDKETYDKEAPVLRAAMLAAQYKVLAAARFPIVILINGVEGAGKGETVNLLNEWMDTRHIRNVAFGDPTDEERERPPMWRFWRVLPPRGRSGILFGNWYSEPILQRVAGDIGDDVLDHRLEEIVAFEKMLTDEGAVLVKLWFHLSKKRQRKRLEALEADPQQRWKVTKLDWKRYAHYDEFRRVSEHSLRETSRNEAVWSVVEGADQRYRNLTVGRILLDAMRAKLADGDGAPPPPAAARPPARHAHERRVTAAIDLGKKLARKDYDRQLAKYQRELALLLREPRYRDIGAVAVFEGSDAAGKGGCIRRVTAALDARQYEVVPVASPTDEERAQPYLWRFWRNLPRRGRATLFDRSWYGRVLVERVEGLCPPAEWQRAYAEINDFEEQLARGGIVVAKFWLHISRAEQLRRFREREEVEFKRHKITPDDWRNRKKWAAYDAAINDMVDRTSTEIAPWTLVPAEDKLYGRVHVLKTLCRLIENAL